MKIPNSWNAVFSEVFYDKEVSVLVRADQYDAEGGLITSANVPSSVFFGNVRYTNLKAVQETLGLRYEIDIAITASINTSIAINNIVQYQNKKYLVTDVMPYDSHLLIVGKIWKSE